MLLGSSMHFMFVFAMRTDGSHLYKKRPKFWPQNRPKLGPYGANFAIWKGPGPFWGPRGVQKWLPKAFGEVLEGVRGRKKVVKTRLGSSWSSEATLFQPKWPPQGAPKSPPRGSQRGLKLKTRQSLKPLFFLGKTAVFSTRGGPRWAQNRLEIASRTTSGSRSLPDRVQEGSERAPRAKKSSPSEVLDRLRRS